MNLAQDLSPGMALWVNALVPEARLSPWSTRPFAHLCASSFFRFRIQFFAGAGFWFSHGLGARGIGEPSLLLPPTSPLRSDRLHLGQAEVVEPNDASRRFVVAELWFSFDRD